MSEKGVGSIALTGVGPGGLVRCVDAGEASDGYTTGEVYRVIDHHGRPCVARRGWNIPMFGYGARWEAVDA